MSGVKQRYGKEVLVGEWNELRHMQLVKSGAEFTLLPKYRKMLSHLLVPMQLNLSPKTICYGARSCLKVPSVQGSEKGVALFGIKPPEQLEHDNQDLCNGNGLVGSPHVQPVAGNCFVFAGVDGSMCYSQFLNYYDEFALILASSLKKEPLFVRYDRLPLPGDTAFPVYLSNFPNKNTRWQIVPVADANTSRVDKEGTHVLVNQNVVIRHCATNTNLAVNDGEWKQDLLGKHVPVIVKNFLNVYRSETPRNIWNIIASVPETNETHASKAITQVN